MASADFTVDAAPRVGEHVVAYGATVNLALTSLAGVSTIAWSIVGSSVSGEATPTITPSGSPSGATATFPMPADPSDGLGRTFLVQCRVTDGAGTRDTQSAVVGAVNSAGYLPMVAGETLQRSATHGYTETFNRALNFTLSSSPTFTGGITIQRDRPALTLTDTDTVLSSGESAAVIIVNTSDDDGGVGLAGAIEFLGAGTTGAVAIDLRTAAPGGVGTVASRLHADSTRVTIPGNLRVDGTLGLRANGGASSLILPKRTATLIGDATDSINTTDKVGGKMIIDTTNGRFLRCNGADGTAATATTPWLNLDGTTAITPA